MYCSKKNKPTFGYAHFPVGTVFKFKVRGVDPVEQIAKVRELVKNGPNSYLVYTNLASSYLVYTNLASELTDWRMINISHATAIVKRGPGLATITVDRKTRYQQDWEMLPSSRTHYHTHSLRGLLSDLVIMKANQDQIVDVDKMLYMITRQNVSQFIEYEEGSRGDYYGYAGYHKVSKKKLKAAIHRVFNKCLTNHGDAQRESDKMWDNDTFDDDF